MTDWTIDHVIFTELNINLVDISDNEFLLLHDIYNDNIAKKPYDKESTSLREWVSDFSFIKKQELLHTFDTLHRFKAVVRIHNKNLKQRH